MTAQNTAPTAPSTGRTTLLDVHQVAERMALDSDRVYGLDIPKVRITPGRVRWRARDVEQYIADHLEVDGE